MFLYYCIPILGSYVLIYLWCGKKKIRESAYNTAWYIAKQYVYLEDFCEKKILSKRINCFCPKNNDIKIIGHSEELSLNVTNPYLQGDSSIKNYDFFEIRKNIENKTKCRIVKKVEDIKNVEFIAINKPFLLIELEQNGQRTEIHEFIYHYYLKDNEILGKSFLKWYLNYFFKIKLNDEYKLHLVDKEANILELSPHNSVYLNKNDFIIKII